MILRPNLIPLYFQVFFQYYSYKGKIDVSYITSKYIKIKKPNNISQNFDKHFTFNLELEMDGNIFNYNEFSIILLLILKLWIFQILRK